MDHPFLEGKKGIFIASCVVTDKAKAKWVKFAKKKLASLPSEDFLFLSGCGNLKNGMIDPLFFETYSELAPFKERIVLLPEDPEDYGKDRSQRMKEKIRNFQILSSKAQIFTRKYMVIQMGCDNFCTFCLTVQARGRHKSRPKEEIIEEINEFIRNG
jgi:tRNA A37 methylthiotransferase MiaB